MLRPVRKLTKMIFIAINVMIAFIFLMGAYAKYFDPESWWVVGLFTLILPYLLAALFIFFVIWMIVNRGWALISVSAVLLAWMPLQQLIPFRFKSDFIVGKKTDDIRIMSWNVEHFGILEHRKHPDVKNKMVDLINVYHPDIACFQEVVAGDDNRAINYVYDLVEKLGFKDYFYTYYPKLDFDEHHHFGIIIFSKYPILNKKTVSYPPYDYNSTFQYIDIIRAADTFRVFNIHLQSLRFSADNIQYISNPGAKSEVDVKETKSIISKIKNGIVKRSVQAKRIKQEISMSPYPVILCGDFNDVPDSYAYSVIGEGMHNAFAEKGRGIGNTFSSLAPTLRIDNIFADSSFQVQQYIRVRKKLSDHYPVIADLHLLNPH
ncbi:endonuclease/exonuclease/phosphatase family protein [soil metagenome]